MSRPAVQPDAVASLIVAIRGERVMLDTAAEVNIAIMRTFVQLRRMMDSNRDLARKIEAMEKKYDEQFGVVFDAIKGLIADDTARKAQPKLHRFPSLSTPWPRSRTPPPRPSKP